tara:strand:+ start:1616 stop:1822 length:207 start_codon:yes stop_codon:yes gene_type:complete
MRKNLLITFPNESYPICIPVDVEDLIVKEVFKNEYFGDVIFCWLGDIYVNLNSKDLDSETLEIIMGTK